MNNTATPVNAYLPASIQKFDGVDWMIFYNNGTFEEYKEMPKVLLYNGKYFGKMGWNSDTFTVQYKEMPEDKIAFPV